MNKKQIERRLEHAGAQLPLPGFERIAEPPVQRMEEHDYITRQPSPRPPRLARRVLTAAAACCALALAAGLGWFAALRAVDSVVFLDVNPSLQITANRQEQVLAVTALNPDAETLLQGEDYRGRPLEQAVDSLVERLAEQGYLASGRGTVLLTVQNKSSARAQRLEQGLAASIRRTLAPRGIQPTLVSQTLTPDAGAASQAADYQISAGRLWYIRQLLASTDDYTLEQLAAMDMEQLAALAADEAEDEDDEDDEDDLPDASEDDEDDGDDEKESDSPACPDEDDEQEGPDRDEPDEDEDEDEGRRGTGASHEDGQDDGPDDPEQGDDPEEGED